MTERHCWICGKKVTQSAVSKSDKERFYLEVRMIEVNRPYSTNWKGKPVWICHKCSIEKIGLDHQGKNLNNDELTIVSILDRFPALYEYDYKWKDSKKK